MKRYSYFALIGGSLALCAPAFAQSSRMLPDGTLVVSANVVAAEMLMDQDKARRKYAGKAIQVQGPMTSKQVTDRGLDLTIMAQPPGYVGYKKFWCRSKDKPSEFAVESLALDSEVTIVGIYQPETRGDIPADDIRRLQFAEKLDWNSMMRLDSCIVLTNNPEGESGRSSVAAKAAGGQDRKQ